MHIVKAKSAWSKSELASEFEIDRRTVAKLLEGVPATEEIKGNAAYRLMDVALVLSSYKSKSPYLAAVSAGEELDPDMLPPKERKEYYEGTIKKMEIEVKRGELVPVEDHRRELADMAKVMKNAMMSLADTADATCVLPPEAIDLIDRVARKTLALIADEMVA